MINSILTHVLLDLLTGEGGTIVTSHHMWYSMSCEDSVQLWDNAASRCRTNNHNLRELWVCVDGKNKYSPEGKGPQMSMWTVWQESGGKGDIWRGSGWLLGPLAWHAMQFLIILWAVSSIPGNRIFSQRSCFVFTRPWWPSCAIDTALLRRAAGMTIWLSRRMILVSWLTVSSCRTCLNRFNSARSASLNCSGSYSMFLHDFVHMRLAKHCMVMSCAVDSWILAKVIAFGTGGWCKKIDIHLC